MDETVRNDGANAKILMGLHKSNQKSIAEKLGWHESTLSNMLKQDVIEDADLESIAKGIDEKLTGDCIKYFNHEEAKNAVINYLFQTINDGGKAYNSGSSDRSIINELAFIEKYAETRAKLMYYRMLVEPEKVKAEML